MASELRVNNIKNRSGLGTVTFADEGLIIAGITSINLGNSNLIVGSGSSTGTENQVLQAHGGAYVSGNLGVGNTNPQYDLDVDGDINLTGTFRQNGSQFVASRWTSGTGDDIYRLDGDVGIGTTNPTSKLDVSGDARVTGVVTATTFVGALTGTATTATALQNSRTFEITGDIIASPISFDGTGNVSLAATIQPNSVALGTDTTGDYVTNITGTSNQITVTSGTGEGSTPTLSVPNQFTAPQDVTVTRDLQVNRNLNVNGNITIGGTSAFISAAELKIYDPDIVLGVRTDGSGNDISTDNTANHGGIAIASTEGSPLISLYDVGVGETNPATYKKFMWFKSGTFSGLGTDAWLSNYAVGIGSTQFPTGTRLVAGNIQLSENDINVVRNINSSGVVTATSATVNGGNLLVGSTSATGTSSQPLQVTGGAYVSGNLGVGKTNPPVSPILHTGAMLMDDDGGYYGGQAYYNGGWRNSVSNQGGYAIRNTGGNFTIFTGPSPGTANSFFTVFSEKLRIDGGGNVLVGSSSSTGTASQPLQVTGGAYVSGSVGVGVTNPQNPLHISGSPGTLLRLDGGAGGTGTRDVLFTEFNTTAYGGIIRYDSVADLFTFGTVENSVVVNAINVTRAAGNVGIGLTNPSTTLQVNGTATVTTLVETSSIALKENINPIENALDKILQLNPVTYDRKNNISKNEAGLIAEEVNEILPNIVSKDGDGNPNGINYTKLSVYLIDAIKTLKKEIEDLRNGNS